MKVGSKTLGTIAAAVMIGAVAATMNIQQASAFGFVERQQFKKLTHEFEKNVIEAASIGNPEIIPGLLEQYNADVRAIDFTR